MAAHTRPSIDGAPLTKERYVAVASEEIAKLGDATRFAKARALFDELVLADRFEEFLTLPAYEQLTGDRTP